MKIQIGVSTALCPWNPRKVFELAHRFNIGVELLPFKWHGLEFVEKMMAAYPMAKLLGVHAPFFRHHKDYWSAIRRASLKEKLFQFVWLLLMGDWRSNPAVRIAEKFSCYLNCHSTGFIRRRDLNLLVENAARHEFAIKNPLTVSEFARDFGIGTTLDVCHLYDCGHNILDALRIMNPKVIHLSNGPLAGEKHAHLPIQAGMGVPMGRFLTEVRRRGKDTIIILEYKPLPRYSWEKVVKDSLVIIHEIFNG